MTKIAGIESNSTICGGEPCISHTHIPVWLIVHAHQGGTNDTIILKNYPELTRVDLRHAFTYYRNHAKEIDAQIQSNIIA